MLNLTVIPPWRYIWKICIMLLAHYVSFHPGATMPRHGRRHVIVSIAVCTYYSIIVARRVTCRSESIPVSAVLIISITSGSRLVWALTGKHKIKSLRQFPSLLIRILCVAYVLHPGPIISKDPAEIMLPVSFSRPGHTWLNSILILFNLLKYPGRPGRNLNITIAFSSITRTDFFPQC